MNRIKLLLIILCLLSFASCRSTKKAVKTNVDTVTVTDTKQESKVVETVKSNADLNAETITEIVETNYFNPDSVKTTIIKDGVVKSVITTVTKVRVIDKGKVETVKDNQVKTDIYVKEKDNSEIDTLDKETVPIQWWPIFGILCIFVVAFIYFKGINLTKIFTKNK